MPKVVQDRKDGSDYAANSTDRKSYRFSGSVATLDFETSLLSLHGMLAPAPVFFQQFPIRPGAHIVGLRIKRV
jgi:hypothetical protein